MQNIERHERRLVPVPEFAAEVGISIRAAWGLISQGEVPVIRIGTRTVRVDRRDLERFIEERRERRGVGR